MPTDMRDPDICVRAEDRGWFVFVNFVETQISILEEDLGKEFGGKTRSIREHVEAGGQVCDGSSMALYFIPDMLPSTFGSEAKTH